MSESLSKRLSRVHEHIVAIHAPSYHTQALQEAIDQISQIESGIATAGDPALKYTEQNMQEAVHQTIMTIFQLFDAKPKLSMEEIYKLHPDLATVIDQMVDEDVIESERYQGKDTMFEGE